MDFRSTMTERLGKGGGGLYQHIQASIIGEACHQSSDERIATNRGKNVSFVSYMFNLFEFDDCTL